MLDPSTLAFLGQFGSFGTGPASSRTPTTSRSTRRGRLYVADNLNNRVDVFDAARLRASLGAFGRGGYAAVPGQLAIVRSVGALADDPRGGVLVADTANNRAAGVRRGRQRHRRLGHPGRGTGYVTRPRGVAFAPRRRDRGGRHVRPSRRALRGRTAPTPASTGGSAASTGFAAPDDGPGEFQLPRGVAYDAAGDLWVADTANDRVLELAPDGTVLRTVGGLSAPARGRRPAMRRRDRRHGPRHRAQVDGTTWSGLSHPDAVACDGTTVYAADDAGVRDLTHGVDVLPGTWDHPTGLAAGGGVLYVAEARRVRAREHGATTTLVAGEGTGAGEVVGAAGLALSPDGRSLLVADAGNNRVLRFDEPGVAVPHPPQLTVSVDAITRGRVTSDPPGIELRDRLPPALRRRTRGDPHGDRGAGSVFAGWTGACTGASAVCTVALGGDAAVGASFAPAPPAPAPAAPAPPPPPRLAPVALRGLRIVPRTLRRRARATLRLSRPATLTVAVEAGRPGRRRGSQCVAPRRPLHQRCTRYVAVRGSRTLRAHAGAYAFTLTRRFAGRTLRPGRYRLAVVARDAAGNRVGPLTARFTVAR